MRIPSVLTHVAFAALCSSVCSFVVAKRGSDEQTAARSQITKLQAEQSDCEKLRERAKIVADEFLSCDAWRTQMVDIQQSEISRSLQTRALDVERLTGQTLYDKHGNFDLSLALCLTQKLTHKKSGGDREAMRRALIYGYGPRAGMAVLNARCQN